MKNIKMKPIIRAVEDFIDEEDNISEENLFRLNTALQALNAVTPSYHKNILKNCRINSIHFSKNKVVVHYCFVKLDTGIPYSKDFQWIGVGEELQDFIELDLEIAGIYEITTEKRGENRWAWVDAEELSAPKEIF